MDSKEIADQPNFIELTAEVVAAFVMHNSIQKGDLPELIASVHSSLSLLANPKAPEAEKPVPAVPIKKSISPDYLISLEDGRRYKSLKRHLSGRGLTPERYREKWGLSPDYPMVAPNYAKQRSELAKSMGLGRQRKREPEPAPAPAKPRRSRSASAA
ncbi:MucR family transcriptional regulator [Enterovirga rhinocerotis]|uniref:MucR family transcriptional regulator n=1 Tax=Enterovirga rhinocerotis TaxID=1339210 RepID=A0A4R7BVW1_9HYPH|nr:MucR family transcriptional regulator [Enterovirga rhinocerotis]TDR88076.1 MucR family transcriptional regulator [Enterovirga rhinocerotis]